MSEKKPTRPTSPPPAPSQSPSRPVPGSGHRVLDESSRRPGIGQDSGVRIKNDPTVGFTPSTKPPQPPKK